MPLEFYPNLQRASVKERARWETIGDGQGFHWSALDLDLSVEGLIQGMREAIPEPPKATRNSARRASVGAGGRTFNV